MQQIRADDLPQSLLARLLEAGIIAPGDEISESSTSVLLASAFHELIRDADLAASEGPEQGSEGIEEHAGLVLNPGVSLQGAEVAGASFLRLDDAGGDSWVWVESPGSGLVFPILLESRHRAAYQALLDGRCGAAALPLQIRSYLAACEILISSRSDRSLPESRDSPNSGDSICFGPLRDRHSIARGLLTDLQLRVLQTYFRKLRQAGRFELDRQQVLAMRASMHNEPVSRLIQSQLVARVNRVVPESVKASYTYLTTYQPGAVLPRHTDRDQCIWNLSLCIEPETPSPWSMYLEVDEKSVAVRLQPGDAVLYEGARTPHWRDALPGPREVTVLLCHFVPVSFEGGLD